MVQQVAKSLTPGEARQLAPALEALAGEDVTQREGDEDQLVVPSVEMSGLRRV